MQTIIIGILLVIVFVLYRQLESSRSGSNGMREFIASCEKARGDAANSNYQLVTAIIQFGEMLDHSGVDLEKTKYLVESDDLKMLGHILRTLHNYGHEFEINLSSDFHDILMDIGDRYGIEPGPGQKYDLRKIARMAEEIYERVLPSNRNVGN